MANNNYDRMHRGEAPVAPAAIPNRATKKKEAKKRRNKWFWMVLLILLSALVLLALVGAMGSASQSVMLGILGWAGVPFSLLVLILCVLTLSGVFRRHRKWTKAHLSLIIGGSLICVMLVLMLHLAFDEAYGTLQKNEGMEVSYSNYLKLLYAAEPRTVGGVAVGWFAYPFLNVIGQRMSCIVLTVLSSGLLLAMIWPFWTITQSKVVGDNRTRPESYQTANGTMDVAEPQLFVETVDEDHPSKSRRKNKREIFDFGYPNKEQEEEEDAIDQIDENDPTYKRLMREEPDPEKRKRMAKELLLDMTDEEAKRYLGTTEYDPEQDKDSPLQYGKRDNLTAEFGRAYGTTLSQAMQQSAQQEASKPEQEPAPYMAPKTEAERKEQAYGILFGDEPIAKPDFYPPIQRPARPATEGYAPYTPPTSNPTPRQIPDKEDGTYIINPRRTLDDLPRRNRTENADKTAPAPDTPAPEMPISPAQADVLQPKQYPAFADESPLDRALKTLDDHTSTVEQEDDARYVVPPRYTGYGREDAASNRYASGSTSIAPQPKYEQPQAPRYEQVQDKPWQGKEQDKPWQRQAPVEPVRYEEPMRYDEPDEEEEYEEDFDAEAQKVGYVEREESTDVPPAFDGFVARAMPEPQEEEPDEEEQPLPKEPDVKPRFLAVPDEKTERQARACQPKPEVKKVRPYAAPSLYLLRDFPPPVDMEDYEVMYHSIEDAFASYGMEVHVLGHTRGPTYTQYAVQLADGLTFKRVAGYEQDIVRKMRLSEEITLVPKVPNMDAIGVEVVNKTRSTVGLKPLLTSSVFRKDKKLYFALGVDVMGNPYYCDILSGPHMLIAGSSGSGKSVCLNTLICSILFNYKPDYVKFILIDPKGGVEMDVYNDLPHNLLGQAATNPTATLRALDWAIEEMERRYALMRNVNIRSLGDYNDKMVAGNLPRLPYILVIIDELADLMKLNKKMASDMETRISRLTAKARACGIHVIVATQRPSVDVITGTIKNNIPTRVAFRTATQIDSKTILEKGCAEKLYGKGDLFLMANGANELKRLQCPFLSDEEVFAICEDIRSHNDSVVDPSITARIFKEEAADDAQIEEDFGISPPKSGDETTGDTLFERVCRFVAAQGGVSISRLQREFRIGFTRAGYLVDEMEKRGFIGPVEPNGSNRPRAVLITPADCDEIFGEGGEDFDI